MHQELCVDHIGSALLTKIKNNKLKDNKMLQVPSEDMSENHGIS